MKIWTYNDINVTGQNLHIQDEQKDFDKSQRGFDNLPRSAGEQQADVVQ